MPISGFLEAIEPFQIRGWAFDSDRPANPLKIEIRVGNKPVALIVANYFREDLKSANIGNGAHGFVINFGTPIDSTQVNNLSATVICKDGERTTLAQLPHAGDKLTPPEPSSSAAGVRQGLRTETARLLKQINAAVAADDIETALRYADHLRRSLPKDEIILHLFGRILARHGDFEGALAQLESARNIAPSPGLEASTIEVLVKLGRLDEASHRLGSALNTFAVTQELQTAARSVCALMGQAPSGWVGLTTELELVGEITGLKSSHDLEILTSEGELLSRTKFIRRANGKFDFSANVPPQTPNTRLLVKAGEFSLIGNGLSYPPDFRVNGRATTTANAIAGWASIGWLPGIPPNVIIEDSAGTIHTVATSSDKSRPGRFYYELDVWKTPLVGPRIDVSVLLPGGGTEPLPDSPLLFVEAVTPIEQLSVFPPYKLAKSAGEWQKLPPQRGTAIIVPVYLGLRETSACLNALFRTVIDDTEIIVINDASPDENISKLLTAFAASGRITLLHNKDNIGFAASVNRGFAHCGERDAVVLNSDVVVHSDWLDRLRVAAYSADDVGTVTPLTDDGTVTSYPATGTSDIEGEHLARLDAITAVVNAGVTVDLPVGVGFCLYVRHDCFEDTGDLDAATFGKGYGEEADFCIRARAHGWRHVMAANVFVHHAGGRSFGKRREALLERSGRILNLRYPGYDAYVQKFLAADPVDPVRRRIDEALLRQETGQHVLLVSLALGGGVARHVTERAESLAKQGLSTLVLEPSKTDSAACILRDGNGQLKHLWYSADEELTALSDLLLGLRLSHIEIHHFLGHSPKLIETMRSLGVPYDIYIHDYSWICPRITLMSGETGYCGEPKVSACETCIKTHGSNIPEKITVKNLRARSAKWLKSARNVIAPTNDVASRLARYFPEIGQTVVPWEPFPAQIDPIPPRGTTIRVAVIGAINASKGYRVLLACARDAAKRKLDIEFLVIGYTENNEPLMRTGKTFVTGKFREDEVSALLARERPHLILYSSVWPETWCYTLTHALKANLPIIAFDIGAIAERLREAGVGLLVSPKILSAELNDLILSTGAKVWQNNIFSPPSSSELSQMSRKRLKTAATSSPGDSEQVKLNTAIINPGQLGALAVGELAATVKPINLDRGLYTFSVRTAAPGTWGDAATLFVPAVHVAIGPGVSADAAEFLPGLPERGAWLYQSGDALVVNVKAQAATLLLTSIRSFGSEPLAIEVERVGESSGGTSAQHGIAALPSGFIPDQAAAPLTRGANRLEILAHIQNRGDVRFVDAHWAGRIGPGLAIEALSIKPLEPLAPGDIEYKGLTATGFETPWVTDGGVCGTKGKATPLIGFALRLKRTAVKQFDCEYLGYFRSGRTVGPFRNGAPCRSTVSNDPLEGIHIRLIAKEKDGSDKKSSHENGIDAAKERPSKPKFGQFRDILESGDSPSDTASKAPPSILENPVKVKGAMDRKAVKTRAPEAHNAASPELPSTASPEKPKPT